MTYAGYLLLFLGAPIVVLLTLAWRRPAVRRARLAWLGLLALAVVAVVYTTPWDNYLVAGGVWWYDPARVLGIVLGWVPLEEYAFFVLQTLLTGLWLILLLPPHPARLPRPAPWRWQAWRPGLLAAAGLAALWLASVAVLLSGWLPGFYLAIELAWFLPPILLQLVVGGRILWQQRRLVAAALLPPLAYLVATDAYAIGQGIWSISPQHTLGVLIGGVLPVEEIVFFTLTNVLIVFGLALFVAIGQRWSPPQGSHG